ncbi:hypothetical protein AXF42_Ash011800 [Apostasia shenzhenica]|uniref:Uncharacterized protein n=1 Tax=Apostasia shenzhenica TaxID=1088818 RepID=A0A2I0AVY0_9ASPA|nr:hypothetical protein AXF42_Ash011800 [Apostasia shenzhenica]
MMHITGSKPFREIIYEKGGSSGHPPNAQIFFETKKKGETLIQNDRLQKHVN